ncbi:MAG: metal-dependent hydrolase family protein [Candidatus Dormibacteria bacterium]
MALILEHGLIIDCTGRGAFDGYVVVEDGWIVEVGDGQLRERRRGAQVVDCGGWTVVPGLIDAHTHHGAVDHDVAEQHRRYHDSYTALAVGRRLEGSLARGFTTTRDAGGADAGFREAVKAGLIVGPRLLVSGRPMSQTGGHGDMRRPVERGDPLGLAAQIGQVRHVVDGVDEVRKAVREELRRGADQIKVMASGGVVSPTDRLQSSQFSVEELRVACEEAEAAGSYVLAHAYTPAAILRCVEAGVRSIEHGNLLDAGAAAAMAGGGQYLVPTLVAYETSYQRLSEARGSKEALDKLTLVYDRGQNAMRLALEAGVPIGSGSDLLGPMAVHQARELVLQAEVQGCMGALESATRVNAELLRMGNEIGTIERGKIADLLVVEGDLTESLEALGNPSSLHGIIRGGAIYRWEV